MEKIEAFLKELENNPKAAELLQGSGQSELDKAEAFAKAAKELGYDISADDFKAYVLEKAQAVKGKTEEGAAAIESLSDDEVEGAAGGSTGHKECFQTYKDKENCAFYDGCDMVYRHYDNYQCWGYQKGHELCKKIMI